MEKGKAEKVNKEKEVKDKKFKDGMTKVDKLEAVGKFRKAWMKVPDITEFPKITTRYANAKHPYLTEDKGKGGGKGKNRKVRYLKMQVIDDLKAERVQVVVFGEVDLEAEVDPDDSTSYKGLEKTVAVHRPKVKPKEKNWQTPPWVHIAISNAKWLVPDIYYNINRKYLQNYVNEYCCKFNRRYFGENLSDGLLIAAVTYKNYFKCNIR